MFRKIALFAVASMLAMLPSTLIAGGPPRLCLPIDGVTTNSLAALTDLLATKLESKLWLSSTPDRGIRIVETKNQKYLMLAMKEDIGLADVEAALKGSSYSIPRDRLHMFGHVILEIQGSSKSASELLAKLDALPHVSIAESETRGDSLIVTVDMPYPQEAIRPHTESLVFETFLRSDFSSDQSTRSEPPATAQKLPGYDDFRAVVAKHGASLKDVVWSTKFSCRIVGCVGTVGKPVRTAAK